MAREGDYISVKLRNDVALRASYCCEYCLIDEVRTGLLCEVDHVIGIKHRGPTVADNLAYGKVTEAILRFNDFKRLRERKPNSFN